MAAVVPEGGAGGASTVASSAEINGEISGGGVAIGKTCVYVDFWLQR